MFEHPYIHRACRTLVETFASLLVLESLSLVYRLTLRKTFREMTLRESITRASKMYLVQMVADHAFYTFAASNGQYYAAHLALMIFFCYYDLLKSESNHAFQYLAYLLRMVN
eukprot:NODE_860_length_3458_cov_1.103007.p5 type:complete len:112 gc:universal NODE_860_length_3458_cov_1.103007:2735-2400(-)